MRDEIVPCRQAMYEGLRNSALLVTVLVATVFMVVLVKGSMDPIRTSVNLHVFAEENYLVEPHDLLGFAPKSNMMLKEYVGTKYFHAFTDSRGARTDSISSLSAQEVGALGVGYSQTWGSGLKIMTPFCQLWGKNLA